MTAAAAIPLRFQVGARTLLAVPRRLVRLSVTLEQALAGEPPPLPPLPDDADGLLVTSLPADMPIAARHRLVRIRQRYTRYHVDLALGRAAWLAGLSGNTRSAIKRKAKRLAAASGGALDIRRYRTAEELAAFYPLARRVSATTYQEKLLGAGLPERADAVAALHALAAADEVRAWLLHLGEDPVAYLCCTADAATLRYTHVGHDPAFAELSPGSVLMAEAIGDLFADRFRHFDFTEGEGQHKRQFASGGVDCVDLLMLRPTPVNRATLAALAAFDGAMARAKRWSRHPSLAKLARRVRR